MIIYCFTFPLLHGYSFSKKLRELHINLQQTVTKSVTNCNRFFFFPSLYRKTLCCTFKLLLQGTVSFSTKRQRWLIRQWFLISAPCLCLALPLIFSPTKLPYSKVCNSRMSQYGNSVFTSNFC